MPLVIQKVTDDFTFSIAKQTTWNTAVTATGVGIPCKDMEITPPITVHNRDRATGVRGNQEAAFEINTDGKIATAKFACPFTLGTETVQFGRDILQAIMPSYAGYTAATNVYTIHTHNSADLPTPKTDNTGAFFTLTRNSPTASDSVQIKNAIMTKLKLSIHPTEHEGCMWCETEWIGQGYARGAAAITTVTPAPLYSTGASKTLCLPWTRIAATNGFKYDTNDLSSCVQSWEVEISSGAKYNDDNPLGGVVYPRWDIKGKFRVGHLATTVETLKGYCLSRAPSLAKALVLDFGDGTTDPNAAGEATFSSFCYLTNWETDWSEGEKTTFDFEGTFAGATNTDLPFEAKIFVET